MMDEIEWLQTWYQNCCDGRWEHEYGIKIGTLDNPGWRIRIDLAGTPVEGRAMEPIEADRSDTDWLFCKIEEGAFVGHGDPTKLTKMIAIFREWVSRSDSGR